MNILFRVDSGFHIGNGHLIRMLRLAKKLSDNNCKVFFCARSHYLNANSLIPKEYPLIEINEGAFVQGDDIGQESEWLGGAVAEELKLLNTEIERLKIEMVVIDHYGIDAEYEKQLMVKNILVVDDMMNRMHHCDYLVDHNLSAVLEKYKDLNEKDGAKYFMGANYSLTCESFLKAREEYTFGEKVENILITFGAMDPTHETLKVVKAFSSSKTKAKLVVILNEKHPTYLEVKTFESPNIKVETYIENMSGFLSGFDLCIGACGTSAIERAIVGIPSILVEVALNQTLIAKEFNERSMAHYLGQARGISEKDWLDIFTRLQDVYEGIKPMAANGKEVYRGRGLSNLIKELNEDLNFIR